MNILPPKEKKILKKGFILRFYLTATILLGAAFLIGTILLIPSYLLTRSVSVEDEVGEYISSNEIADEILNLPTEVEIKLGFFQAQLNEVSVSKTLAEVIGQKKSGISVNSISFNRKGQAGEKSGVMITVGGIAYDRNSLISFEDALNQSSAFSSVTLPVSNLAKDRNIPFSVNVFVENQI